VSTIEGLQRAYEQRLHQPWPTGLSGAEKVWLLIYEPAQERRLRLRLPLFEEATRAAGHGWLHVDLTDSFAEWMAGLRARDQYFERPDRMAMRLPQYTDAVAGRIAAALDQADANGVVAISGVGSLFGLASVSDVLNRVTGQVRGRLAVFFPGQRDGNNYRLLDAHDGWNYLAVPIEAANGS